MIADPLWSCVMLLCGPLWVLCGPLRSFVGPLRSFVVLCGPLRYLVIPLCRLMATRFHYSTAYGSPYCWGCMWLINRATL